MVRKVLYVSPCAERAGAEQLTKLFALNHDRARWQPEFFFLKDGPFVGELRELGFLCHVLPGEKAMRLRKPLSVYGAARHLAQVIRAREIDLVHSMMGYGHIVGGWAAALAGIPEVWYQHGPTGALDYLTGLVPTRAILVNSEYTQGQQARYRARTLKTKVIHPGIDPVQSASDFSDEAGRLRASWCSPRAGAAGDDDFVFGLIGRIAPMKGQDLFVSAAERVARDFSRARFILIGSQFEGTNGAYAKRVRAMLEKSAIRERFVLTGFLPHPQPAILACDAIVNASRVPEPFGLTLLESLQMGRPVIAPDRGGPLEIFEHALQGLFFTSGDVASLAAAMAKMIGFRQDPARWAELQASAIVRAEKNFSVGRMMHALETECDLACNRT